MHFFVATGRPFLLKVWTDTLFVGRPGPGTGYLTETNLNRKEVEEAEDF